jgi:drug/metabolite transporter (DMT)-like permease
MSTPIPAILPAPPPVLRAALWMTGAIASFSAMAVAGREASFDLDTFEIMLYRSIVGVIIVFVVLTATRRWHEVSRRHPGLQIMRNLAHFSGQNLWFYAVTVIPLAQVFALEFTSPLWVLVLSPLVLGERMTPIRTLAAVLGFTGILIVARPTAESLNPGVITAALSAVCFAFTIMLTKKLTRTESIACILFYLTTTQVVFGLIAAGYDGDIALPSATSLPYVVVIGCAGLMAHFCLTNALSIAPATVVIPIDFARLPVIAVVGMLLYQEPLDLFVFAGALVIFAGNYLNIWHETRRPKPAA